jgi:hypothetical protein
MAPGNGSDTRESGDIADKSGSPRLLPFFSLTAYFVASMLINNFLYFHAYASLHVKFYNQKNQPLINLRKVTQTLN